MSVAVVTGASSGLGQVIARSLLDAGWQVALAGRRSELLAETELTKRFRQGVLQANGSMMAEPVFDSKHVADAVLYMASLPLDANVQFLTITATTMPYIGRG